MTNWHLGRDFLESDVLEFYELGTAGLGEMMMVVVVVVIIMIIIIIVVIIIMIMVMVAGGAG